MPSAKIAIISRKAKRTVASKETKKYIRLRAPIYVFGK